MTESDLQHKRELMALAQRMKDHFTRFGHHDAAQYCYDLILTSFDHGYGLGRAEGRRELASELAPAASATKDKIEDVKGAIKKFRDLF